jgi:hypothetical protein
MDSTHLSQDFFVISFGKLDLKGRSNNLLFTGDPPYGEKQTLAYVERLDEDLPSQWSPKTGRSNNTYLRQSRLQTYIDQRR